VGDKLRPHAKKIKEKNDQIDCCCRLCLGRRNFGASNDGAAVSPLGRRWMLSRSSAAPEKWCNGRQDDNRNQQKK